MLIPTMTWLFYVGPQFLPRFVRVSLLWLLAIVALDWLPWCLNMPRQCRNMLRLSLAKMISPGPGVLWALFWIHCVLLLWARMCLLCWLMGRCVLRLWALSNE